MTTATSQSRIKTHPFQLIFLGVLVGMGTFVSSSFRAAIAQTTAIPQPLEGFQSSDKSTGIFDNSSSGPSSMFDLIHRSMQAPSQSPEDFTDSQEDSLNSATQDFLKKQQERLQSQPTSSTPATPAAPAQN